MTVTLHTICSLLSYVAFLTAFAAGALFLVQERQLKHKHMGMLFRRLPALRTLDRLNALSIGVGFLLLTIGLGCGVVGARRLFGRWWDWDPKEAFALFLWGLYFMLWILRLRATLRGRKVAVLSILGFGLVIFTFLGVSRWLPTWHAYL